MFHRLGQFVARRWPWVIVAWVIALVALRCTVPRWEDVTLDGDLEYLPREMTSVRGDQLLAEAFPELRARSQIAVVIERPDGALTADDDQRIRELYHAVRTELAVCHPERSEGPQPSDGDAEVLRCAQNDTSIPHSEFRIPNFPATDPLLTEIWAPVVLSANDAGQRALAAQLRSEVSDGGQAALLVLHLRSEFMATANMPVLKRVLAVLDDVRSRDDFAASGLRLGVAGSAAIGSDMLTAAAESIRRTEIATIALVLVILLVVYRAPLLALIPLVTLFVASAVATDLVAALATSSAQDGWLTFKVFRTTKIFLVVILWGSGTDYFLFLVARYREELGRGLDRAAALAAALGNVGMALTVSALTTIVGLSMMTFAEFGKFRYAGPALALSVSVCLLACVTLAPALWLACGRAVFWPGRRRLRASGFGLQRSAALALPEAGSRSPEVPSLKPEASWLDRFWNGLAGRIIARPGLILIVGFVLLSPLAWHGYGTEPNYDLLSELSPDRPSTQGTAMMRRHFPAGDTGPVTLVARQPRADFRLRDDRSNDDQVMIHDLAQYLSGLEGVRRVHSWAAPLGDPTRSTPVQRALAEPRFVAQTGPLAGQVTRLQIILDSDPFSPLSAARLADLRSRLALLSRGETPAGAAEAPRVGRPLADAWQGAQFEFVGTTASTADLKAVTSRDQTRIQILSALAVLAVMFVLLGHTVICTFLMVSVVFSFLATLGATELVFRAVYGPEFVGVDWKVPLFLFVILVSVGADYSIYLVARVFEEQRRLGPLAGLRQAVVRTGGIISSCGLITAGTFVAMMSGTLRGMLELGFALSLGILLDTFVVRPVLAPAFLAIVSRRQAARTTHPASNADESQNEPIRQRSPPRPSVRQPVQAATRTRTTRV
jgi:RND superfamily putative drug exporter